MEDSRAFFKTMHAKLAYILTNLLLFFFFELVSEEGFQTGAALQPTQQGGGKPRCGFWAEPLGRIGQRPPGGKWWEEQKSLIDRQRQRQCRQVEAETQKSTAGCLPHCQDHTLKTETIPAGRKGLLFLLCKRGR